MRTLGSEDRASFLSVDSHAFGATMPGELIESERDTFEEARGIGAYAGDDLVGIATAYSYRLSVPGAVAPAAAVSWVGVLPTHRRRGVLSALMAHQIHSVHEAGIEPLAILWASEPQIYGRYGYGSATRAYSCTVPRDSRALQAGVPHDPELRLRLADPANWALTAEVYAAVAAARPGVPERDERWWRRAVRDIPALREGRSELRCVIAEDDHGVRGYARYATKQDFADFGAGVVFVREVMATDAAALAALYRYLFDLDLMASTELWNVPVDDPLLHWLTNPRRAKPVLGDALYVRLVDLPRALSSRTYAVELDVVLDVVDELCPWNAGRWRLAGGPAGGGCERSTAPADLSLDVTQLGAAYLGGFALAELAAAGQVSELVPGALPLATSAFAHSPAPWAPAIF